MNGEREKDDREDLVASRNPGAIAGMFNRIAPSYDRMNRILSLGQDIRWRRLTADRAGLRPGDSALDVATGTGDMARELAGRVAPGGHVVGIDIARDMLSIAERKTADLPVEYRCVDVVAMGASEAYDAATVAFGFRNFADREAGARAMAATLRPGGRLVILELVPAHGLLKPFAEFYETRIIPIIGALVSRDRSAYRYLPASVQASVSSAEIGDILRRAGLRDIGSRELNFGSVAIVWGTK